ncbi:MAG: sulfatase [Kiritimatiellae bacterium]|nr:sulfatase [Kiritimatiellia bacterium]
MKKLTTLITLGTLAATLAFAARPNLVYIMADDCTHREFGCYGGQAFTPNIDRLAREGMLFKRCFQAAPMCSPTRHNIYTGLYPVKTGAYPNHTFAKHGTKSIVHYLQPLGYRVALSGKTHIAPKEVFPFEYSGKDNNPEMEVIDRLMAESKSAGTPFCLFATSNEPHTPYNKGDPSRYPPEKVTLPPYYVDTPLLRVQFSKYLAEVTYYDGQVGDILRLLEKHGIKDNTFVMVTSEQGNSFPFAKWSCYDSGLQSAMICRWPGVIKPGSVANAMVEYVDVCPTFINAAGAEVPEILDGKSFMDVLKGKTDEHKKYVYGIMTTRGIINGSDHYGIRSVRSGTHKLIVNLTPEVEFKNACTQSAEFKSWEDKAAAGDANAAELVQRYRFRPAIELYDIVKDPLEMRNIADNPEHAPVIKELQAQLDAWMLAQGDKGAQTEMEALEHQTRSRKKR